MLTTGGRQERIPPVKRTSALLFAAAVLAAAALASRAVDAGRARTVRREAARAAEAAGMRAAGRARDARPRAQARGPERGLQPAPGGGAARQRRRRDAAGPVPHRGLVGALPERVQGLRRRVRRRQAGRHRGDEDGRASRPTSSCARRASARRRSPRSSWARAGRTRRRPPTSRCPGGRTRRCCVLARPIDDGGGPQAGREGARRRAAVRRHARRDRGGRRLRARAPARGGRLRDARAPSTRRATAPGRPP